MKASLFYFHHPITVENHLTVIVSDSLQKNVERRRKL